MSRDALPLLFGVCLTAGAIHAQAQYTYPEYWSTGPIRPGAGWTQPYYGYPYPQPAMPAPEQGAESGAITMPMRPAPQAPPAFSSASDVTAALQELSNRLSALERRVERLESLVGSRPAASGEGRGK
jgi:hypothetical protein